MTSRALAAASNVAERPRPLSPDPEVLGLAFGGFGMAAVSDDGTD